jgi:hypothetical protein
MTGANQDRLLFYFAPASQLPRLTSERLIPTDTSIAGGLFGLVGRRGGLVWLSDSAELLREQARGVAQVRPGVRGPAAELVRVTAAVPDAQYWPRWARRHLVGRRRRRRIDALAGGSSGRWWVAARPVPATAWLRIDTAAGVQLWPESDREAVASRQLFVPSAFRRADVDWPSRTPPRSVARHRPKPG